MTTDYERHAPVKASQAAPCGCPAVGGHFDGCPVLDDTATPTSAIRRHAFVESGPGQEPTTVRGVIVCPDCYQPKRSAAHVA